MRSFSAAPPLLQRTRWAEGSGIDVSGHTPIASPNKGRVLLVDDDTHLRDSLAAVLSAEGFDTAGASDGQEALDKLDVWRADVIVTDLIMPGLDVFNFCACCAVEVK